MRGPAVTALAVLTLFLSAAAPAAAGRDWCEDDPVISIHGFAVHVTAGFDATYLRSLNGPVQYVAVVRKSDASATRIDTSLATLPTTATVYTLDDRTFTRSFGGRTDVVIAVKVQAQKSFSTVNTYTSRLGSKARLLSQNGNSNAWVVVSYDFQ